MPRGGEAQCIMNYYVDIHANLLPGLAGLGGGTLTGKEAEERLAVFQESNIKLAVAAPYYDPEQRTPETFVAQRDEKIAALEQCISFSSLIFFFVKFGLFLQSIQLQLKQY